MKGRFISVTIPKPYYDLLLDGRKKAGDEIGIKGCGTYEKLVEYVNDTFGLLGTVTEVHWV